jgi:hypothetical protein
MTRIPRISLAATVIFLCATSQTFALTEGQCLAFAVDGSTAICHATGSPNQPFAPLEIPIQACIHGHVDHSNDYVAVGDPACTGGGCLPSGAPCDPTLPCCEGLACNDGICGPPIEDVTTATARDDLAPSCLPAAAGEVISDFSFDGRGVARLH